MAVLLGSSLGGVLHPIMLNNLFHGQVGFQNGVRASAGLVSGLMLLAIALMRTRLPPGKPTDMVPKLKAFSRDSPYVLAVIGSVFMSDTLIFFC